MEEGKEEVKGGVDPNKKKTKFPAIIEIHPSAVSPPCWHMPGRYLNIYIVQIL